MKDAGADEIEASSAVHGSLDHLDAADLSFDRARRPGQIKGGLDGVLVAAQVALLRKTRG
jgi:hypothetical protein